MKVSLTIEKGPQQGRVITFEKPGNMLIGRANDADFQLPQDDPYVSRRHVYLEICPPSCRLSNLSNTNPPHVNNQPVDSKDLANGDLIELGYTRIRIGIGTQFEVATKNCSKCGEPIEVLPDQTVPKLCVNCGRSQSRKSGQRVSAKCTRCSKDLSEYANSDGRAEELRDTVIYSCEECLPTTQGIDGTCINDYRVILELGEGGFGVVYLVYHPPTARVLALKQIKDLTNDQNVRRFEQEISVLEDLKHPNIVRCIDSGHGAQGIPYLVTEYVVNRLSLDKDLSQPHFVVPIVVSLLDGLEYLHGKSKLHRDIKPDNILFQDRQMYPDKTSAHLKTCLTPKLADFGISFSYARAGGTRLTKPNLGMGTLMFMSPEQVQDAYSVKASADLYSLGVTLYFWLTGKYTFEFLTQEDLEDIRTKARDDRASPKEKLKALKSIQRYQASKHPFLIILGEEPIPIRERLPSLSPELAEVIDKSVRKDQNQRFQSASEFRQALLDAI